MTDGNVLALFPLHTVLFPGGPLPLRIFETRYTDMVRGCMREQRPFGVILIQEGDFLPTHSNGAMVRPQQIFPTYRLAFTLLPLAMQTTVQSLFLLRSLSLNPSLQLLLLQM